MYVRNVHIFGGRRNGKQLSTMCSLTISENVVRQTELLKIDIYNTTSKHLYGKFSSVKLKVSDILSNKLLSLFYSRWNILILYQY